MLRPNKTSYHLLFVTYKSVLTSTSSPNLIIAPISFYYNIIDFPSIVKTSS